MISRSFVNVEEQGTLIIFSGLSQLLSWGGILFVNREISLSVLVAMGVQVLSQLLLIASFYDFENRSRRIDKIILESGKNTDGEVDLDCVICHEPTLGEKEVLKIRCAHLFHRACLKEWFMSSPTCPLCREDLTTDSGD